MLYNIVVLDPKENFLKFLNPDRCVVKETHKEKGLRTIDFEYLFEDFKEEKELFSIGNKIWVQGDTNIRDCLYVINTKVKQDIYQKNTFNVDAEEVLVELNHAPLIFQTFITTDNGFKIRSGEFKVNFNSLKYFFGDYFNIGVVQDTIADYVSYMSLTGSITRMGMLRKIEEETGNVFVTRYEKDKLNNTIHRYLDFLNPLNVSKNWNLNLEYDFADTTVLPPCYDENGDPCEPDKLWEAGRFDDGIADGSLTEDVWYEGKPDWYVKGTPDPSFVWNADNETVKDNDTIRDYTPITNLNPLNVVFRITNPNGEVIDPYIWTAEQLGFDGTEDHVVISLCMVGDVIGIVINEKSFAVLPSDVYTDVDVSYVNITESIDENLQEEDCYPNDNLPDDSYFEIYDTVLERVLFSTEVNRAIGHVHEEVLDFTYNLSNITFDIDETNTYTAISPIIEQKSNDSNSLGKSDIENIITKWKNLNVEKGDIIPMIVERTFQVATTWTNAVTALGPVDVSSNYWQKPYKQQNQLNESDASQNKWEIWKATAYWKAPFTKKAGEYTVKLDETKNIQYHDIIGRPDTRDDKGPKITQKTGTSTTTDEDIYAIYNQMALYLQDHKEPEIDLDVDVANLQNDAFNKYDLHDKVYIKVPDSQELIIANVVETVKEANKPASNNIKLSNYHTKNTVRVIPNKTRIIANNVQFTYPLSKTTTMRLHNMDYDSTDPYSVQYPANKLLTLRVDSVDSNGSKTLYKVYTKRTNASGNITLQMNYDPGDYTCTIQFAGDEEYSESSITIKINVAGIKEVVKPTYTKPDPVPGATVTAGVKYTYYDKYGRTPDKKKIMAIGRISAGRDKGSYANFYETEFVNKCPHCGRDTLLWGIFWAGNEHSNWGRFPGTGRSEGGSAEGHIFCSHCDADYSVQGNEHVSSGKRLTKTKDTTISSKAKAYELMNGKRVYERIVIEVEEKNITGGPRKCINNVAANVKNQALSIVGNKTGLAAAQAIAAWMDKNIWYGDYGNFCNSASTVLSRRRGNCCDQTRLFFEMCDAAGCTEFLKLEYIHVYGHVYGKVTVKSSGKSYTVDCASDSYGAWGYICQGYRNRSVLHRTTYPTRPF